MPKTGRTIFSRLAVLIRPIFIASETRLIAWGLLLLLITLSSSRIGMDVLRSFLERNLLTSLELREGGEFFKQLYRLLGAIILSTAAAVFARYTEERLALFSRRRLGVEVLGRYFSARSFYKINAYEGIDNPDQRIEEDVRSFAVSCLSIFMILFNSVVSLVSFMFILASISWNLTLAAVLYALFGSVTTYLLGRPLISLNFTQLKKEADYRYKLVNIRDNAESIAFYGGESKEYTRSRQRLKGALSNLLRIINWNRNLNFFTIPYNYLITILPVVVVAPMYFDGRIQFGVVWQSITAFSQAVNALSIMVLNFGSLSVLAAVINRLGGFWEGLEQARREEAGGRDRFMIVEKPQIEFRGVSIYTPMRDQLLVKDLSLNLENRRLLITGHSGSGKSSILRTIAGLWSAGQGTIVRPPLKDMLFLPQRPYMVLGSFRSQFLYSARRTSLSDDDLRSVLQEVGLEDTLRRIGGFEMVLDWPNVLSSGEQQRVAFARLLLNRPRFAFLDEATTAMDSDSERALYELLQGFTRSYISVGYRSILAGYHDLVLELKGNGEWKIEELKKD